MTGPIRPDARVVIVGSGQAGFQVALSLRDRGHRGPVILLGEEPGLPYSRPPLSKTYIAGGCEPSSVTLREKHFYVSRDIAVRDDERVVQIDRDRGRVLLSNDDSVDFDHLVLATGSRARALPLEGADLDGVVTLRTLSDAAALRSLISTGDRRFVLIGGGFIGLEIAATATAARHAATIVETADRLLARAVSPELSDHVAATHRGQGTRILFRSSVRSIHGHDGHVSGVELQNGEVIQADVLVVGVGAVPNAELAAGAGLDVCAVTGGILVDQGLLTADRRISAIGDCATYPSRHAGQQVRLESIQNAVDQARHVVERLITGDAAPYDKVPWFWTNQHDMKIQMAGIGRPHDERLVLGEPDSGAFSVLRFADDRLIAVESVNRPADHVAARRILDRDQRPTPAEARAAGFALKSVRPPA